MCPERGSPTGLHEAKPLMGTFKNRAQILVRFDIFKTIPECIFQKYVDFSNVCVYSKFGTFQNNHPNCAGKKCLVSMMTKHIEKRKHCI